MRLVLIEQNEPEFLGKVSNSSVLATPHKVTVQNGKVMLVQTLILLASMRLTESSLPLA